MSRVVRGVAALTALFILGGCAGLSAFGEEISRAFQGVPATMTTYDQQGQVIDLIQGESFRVSRDERFDFTSTNSDGSSTTNPGDVLLISLGSNHVSHVGSSMILAQDGIVKVADAKTLDIENRDLGTPIINDFFEKTRNLWQGKSKTIVIRSQDGLPIGVFAGDTVEVFPTDVPKSTWFRVDGKYLLVYRVDYTVIDNALL